MGAPKLRFSSFQGEWQEKRLGDLAGFTSGFPFDGSKFGSEGRKLVIPKNFTKFGYGNFSPEYSKFTTEECSPSYICKSGELLLLMTDLSRECELLGKPLYLRDSDKEVLLNQRIAKIIASNEVQLPFLLNLLLTEKYHKKIKELATGSTVKHLSLSSIKSIALKTPGGDEQLKIASFLSKVDSRIENLLKRHKLLLQYKKGVMRKIFNQEIRFKDENSKDFPRWKNVLLSDVAQIVGGGTPDTNKESYWGGNIQWFTPTELKKKYVSKSVRTISQDGLKNSSAKMLPKGAILFSSRATVGDVSIAMNECCTNQGFQSFVTKDSNNNEFLYYWLGVNKNLFLEKAAGSTFLEISKKELEKISITMPVVEEQSMIANFLIALDKKIEGIKTQIELTQKFKQGLLQQMFI